MDFRLHFCKVSVKHGIEDRASDSQNVLWMREQAALRPGPSLPPAAATPQVEDSPHSGGGLSPLGAQRTRPLPTLWAGTLRALPGGPTMKWTSAMSSLLNISAFL